MVLTGNNEKKKENKDVKKTYFPKEIFKPKIPKRDLNRNEKSRYQRGFPKTSKIGSKEK